MGRIWLGKREAGIVPAEDLAEMLGRIALPRETQIADVERF
jgi:hypothetical protein